MNYNFFNDGIFQQRADMSCERYMTIGLARCTLAQWLEFSPILQNNELGFITDTKEFVLGDGKTEFIKLKRYKFLEVQNEAN